MCFCCVLRYFLPQNSPKCVWQPGSAGEAYCAPLDLIAGLRRVEVAERERWGKYATTFEILCTLILDKWVIWNPSSHYLVVYYVESQLAEHMLRCTIRTRCWV